MSELEDTLVLQIKLAGLPLPVREFACIPGRKFRFDLAWPKHGLLMEVDGGTWISGRHSRGAGQASDGEKSNLATLAGWKVLRATSDHIKSGKAIGWLQAFFRVGGNQ